MRAKYPMKKTLISLILISMIITQSKYVFADNVYANQVIEICQDRNQTFTCDIFMAGAIQGMMAGMFLNPSTNSPLSAITLRNTFVKHMTDHPEAGDQYMPPVLAMLAVKANFMEWRSIQHEKFIKK